MRILGTISLTLTILLSGCASNSSSFGLLKEDTETQLLVLDCKNVDKRQDIADLITDEALLSAKSFFSELGKYTTRNSKPLARADITLLSRMPPDKTYCMNLETTYAEANRAIVEVLRRLNDEIVSADSSFGEYETQYRLVSKGPIKQWKEKYLVFATESMEGGVDVRVYREILMSREKPAKGEDRAFYEAISNGQNEAWFLLELARLVE